MTMCVLNYNCNLIFITVIAFGNQVSLFRIDQLTVYLHIARAVQYS